MDGCIVRRVFCVVTEIVVTSYSGPGFGSGEVGGVGMKAIYHGAGGEAYLGIGISGCIVEQFDGGLSCGLSAVGLSCAKFIESN